MAGPRQHSDSTKKSKEDYLKQMQAYYGHHVYSEAIRSAKHALSDYPNWAKAYLMTAEACRAGVDESQGSKEKREGRLKAVLHYRLAQIFSSKEEIETIRSAEKGLQKLYQDLEYKSHPVEPYKSAVDEEEKDTALYEKAKKLFAEKKFEESLKIFDTLLERVPTCKKFYYHRGRCRSELHHYEEASIDFEIWRFLEDTFPDKEDPKKTAEKKQDVRRLLGEAYYELKHFDEARRVLFMRFRSMKPDQIDMRVFLMYAKTGFELRLDGYGILDIRRAIEVSWARKENAGYREEALSLFEKVVAHHKDGKNKADKEAIFESIKEVEPTEAQIALLERCLNNKESPLGKILWTKRKGKECSLGEGRLKKMNKHLRELKKKLPPPVASNPNTLFAADFGMPGTGDLNNDFLDTPKEIADKKAKAAQPVKPKR